MLEFTVRHEIRCSTERFWEIFFDPEFTRDMIVGGLGFAKCDVGDIEKKDGKWTRKMVVVPKINVPAAVAKLLGPKLAYTERGTFDTSDESWTHTETLSVLSERIRLGGRATAEPKGDDRCIRVSALWTEARILGIGGIVERAAENNLRDGWKKSAAYINKWLDAHAEPK